MRFSIHSELSPEMNTKWYYIAYPKNNWYFYVRNKSQTHLASPQLPLPAKRLPLSAKRPLRSGLVRSTVRLMQGIHLFGMLHLQRWGSQSLTPHQSQRPAHQVPTIPCSIFIEKFATELKTYEQNKNGKEFFPKVMRERSKELLLDLQKMEADVI